MMMMMMMTVMMMNKYDVRNIPFADSILGVDDAEGKHI